MEQTADQIARMVEALLWDYEPEWTPPGLELVERSDLLMWASASPSSNANRVVRAALTSSGADGEISRVIEFFHERERPFTWVIGPSTLPGDLGARLLSRGFTLRGRDHGLARRVETMDVAVPPDISIERVWNETQVREMVSISAAAFGYGPEAAEAVIRERLSYLSLPARRGGYLLARVNGRVVANAGWRDSTDGRCVYLSGAATLEEVRGRGIYTALLAARMSEAAERGCSWAAVQANPGTSSPILRRHGFRQYCVIEVYEHP